jgi:hypothetical protein
MEMQHYKKCMGYKLLFSTARSILQLQMRPSSSSGRTSTRHLALSLQYFHGHPCTVLASRNSGTHQRTTTLEAFPFSCALNCLLVSPCV